MKKSEGDFLQITLHPLIIDLETSKLGFRTIHFIQHKS